MVYARGAVVVGPDLFTDYTDRPYLCLSDETHPFADEEALYTAVTTTGRERAIPLVDADFESGGLPRESFVNPWTIVSIRHADIRDRAGRLTEEKTHTVAVEAAGYLGIE